jgi:hypothetical protein
VSRCRQAPGPPLRVSKGDPFASCLVGGNGSGLNYRSAEVEPWIADKPANTANLIGTWQQDRWSDGGAKGQVASWSFDAGRTWSQTPQPFTKCAQPFYGTPVLQYERTSDPWVSIGPDGTAYAVSLPFDGNFIRNGLGTAVSRHPRPLGRQGVGDGRPPARRLGLRSLGPTPGHLPALSDRPGAGSGESRTRRPTPGAGCGRRATAVPQPIHGPGLLQPHPRWRQELGEAAADRPHRAQ